MEIKDYSEVYSELWKLTHELESYYSVDKVKPWAVYVWTKDTPEAEGEYVFDITAYGLVYYVEDHVIPAEAMPIIRKIQAKLRKVI